MSMIKYYDDDDEIISSMRALKEMKYDDLQWIVNQLFLTLNKLWSLKEL